MQDREINNQTYTKVRKSGDLSIFNYLNYKYGRKKLPKNFLKGYTLKTINGRVYLYKYDKKLGKYVSLGNVYKFSIWSKEYLIFELLEQIDNRKPGRKT